MVYQVYPRSFADGGPAHGAHAGIGDLRGIIDKLDYLAWLGVDALWISPIFRSPMADFGYDVSDFCDIDPVFGTLTDFDELVEQAHLRNLRVLLDWVPNHTSDQHPWFRESRLDRTNPKTDWYVWRDEPANNWMAAFPRGDTAWTFDDVRSQYYLRCFLPSQPDLNWDHPPVEAAMLDTLRFWLDRGVDGFRMDVVHLIGKHIDLDDPHPEGRKPAVHVIHNDVPATHQRLRRIRTLLDSYPGDRVSVGEVYLLDEAAMASYYGDNDELHLSFNFPFLWAPFDAAQLSKRIVSTLHHLDTRRAWPTWVLSNHDVPRHRQRYGGSEAAARVAAIMLLTLPGTPFMYQGEELGLVDADVPPHRVVDPDHRDGCRAPIPWTPDALHGWPADPWLPFPPDSDRLDVETQTADADSMLHLYRRTLALRKGAADLRDATFELVEMGGGALSYRRGPWLVVLNLADEPLALDRAMHATLCTAAEHEGHSIEVVPPMTAIVGRVG